MGWGKLEADSLKRIIAGYYGLITHLDQQIGLVLEELHNLGLEENTRLIYTTDHGEMRGSHLDHRSWRNAGIPWIVGEMQLVRRFDCCPFDLLRTWNL